MSSNNTGKGARNIFLVGMFFLAAIAGYYLYSQYELVTDKIDLGQSQRAWRKPFLAAEKFLENNNIEARSSTQLTTTDELPTDAALIISDSRLIPSTDRVERMFQWVEQGGTLIIGAGYTKDDVDILLDWLGLYSYKVKTNNPDKYKKYYIAENPEPYCTFNKKSDTTDWYKNWGWPDTKPVEFGPLANRDEYEKSFDNKDELRLSRPLQNNQTLELDLSSYIAIEAYDDEYSDNSETEDLASTNSNSYMRTWLNHKNHMVIMQQNIGNGVVWVINDLTIWENDSIAYFDHAYFLQMLTKNLSKVTFLHGSQAAGLWTRIFKYFPEALAAFAVTLLLWGWSKIVRVGPIQTQFSPHRRALAEHIRAAAQFTWNSSEPLKLVASAREHVLQILHSKFPGFELYTHNKKLDLISNSARITTNEAERLLYNPPDINNPQEFTQFIASIQRIRKAL